MNRKRNITLITMLFQTTIIILLNQTILIVDDLNALDAIIPFSNIIFLILTALNILSIKEIENNIKTSVESNILKEHLKQINEIISVLQMEKHEFARHLQMIQSMTYLNEIDGLKEYIDGISSNNTVDYNVVNTNNISIASLLNTKQLVAEKNNIKFDFAIKTDITKLNIPSWDLCSLIGNILDNSFDAVMLNSKNREVGFEVVEYEDNILFGFYNNGPKIGKNELNEIFNFGYTTKDSKSRGYGLSIVQNLVNQHNGKIRVSSDNKTTFILTFPARR